MSTHLSIEPPISRPHPARLLPVTLFTVFIFISSECQVTGMAQAVSDKLLHGLCYSILCLCAWYSLGYFIPQPAKPIRLFASLGYCIAFGIFDEIHQSFVPFRTPSFGDVIADACGGLAMICLITLFFRTRI